MKVADGQNCSMESKETKSSIFSVVIGEVPDKIDWIMPQEQPKISKW